MERIELTKYEPQTAISVILLALGVSSFRFGWDTKENKFAYVYLDDEVATKVKDIFATLINK